MTTIRQNCISNKCNALKDCVYDEISIMECELSNLRFR